MGKQELLKMHLQFFAEQDEGSDDPGADEQDKGQQEEGSDEQEKGKTFTEEEVQKMIKDRLVREQKAKEKAVEEAKRLAKMNEDEKKQYEFEQLQKELEEYKRKDSYYGLSKEASKMLAEHSIQADDDLLHFVVKDSAEDTQTAINSFVSLINKKVEEGVKQALAGKPPKVNTTTGQTITKQQIMEIKDPFERKKKIAENPHLFQK